MKLTIDQRLPTDPATLVRRLSDLLVAIARQVNGLTEGGISWVHNAQTTYPTTGTYKAGDFIRNSAPVDDGSGNTVFGWLCVLSGTPGTWLPIGGGGGGVPLTDGDKGDIVVSGSGAVFTIDSAVLSSFARTLIDDANASAARTTLGLGALATLSTVGTAEITNDAVTYAKIQNVTSQRVLGRSTAGSGDTEELTLTQVLDLIGSAAQGDILYRGSSSWSRLAAGQSGKTLTTKGSGQNPAWDGMTVVAVTTAVFSLASTDVQQWLSVNMSTTAVGTITTASGFAVGDTTIFEQMGAGQVQIAAGSMVKLRSSSSTKTRAQYSVIAATRVQDEGSGTAVFNVFGDTA